MTANHSLHDTLMQYISLGVARRANGEIFDQLFCWRDPFQCPLQSVRKWHHAYTSEPLDSCFSIQLPYWEQLDCTGRSLR